MKKKIFFLMLRGRNRDLDFSVHMIFPFKSKPTPPQKRKFKLKEVNSNPLGELIADLKRQTLIPT